MKKITIFDNNQILTIDICNDKNATLNQLSNLLSMYSCMNKGKIDIFIDNVKFNKYGLLEVFSTHEKNNLYFDIDFFGLNETQIKKAIDIVIDFFAKNLKS